MSTPGPAPVPADPSGEDTGRPTAPFLVSFVCTGNICRSPMAEVVARALVAEAGLSDQVSVESYGTGPRYHGEGANPPAVLALGRRGYDGSGHGARQIDPRTIGASDLVLALDSGHLQALRRMIGDRPQLRMLRSFDPASAGQADLDVPDPFQRGDVAFEHALDLVESACRGLVAELPALLAARHPR